MGKRSSTEVSWLGSWSEHKEGVSSVEPEPRVSGFGFAVGWIADGRRAAVVGIERAGGGGCASSGGGWARAGGGGCL